MCPLHSPRALSSPVCFSIRKALMLPPWFLLRALLALLPCATLGSRVDAKRTPSILATSAEFASRTWAWVTPPMLSRGVHGSTRSGLRCAMGSTARGGGGGAAGNQGTGRNGSNNNRSGRPAGGGGVGSLDRSSSSGGGGSKRNNKNNSDTNASGSNNSGGGGGGGSGGDAKSGDFSALERQFSQPAAPRREVISEGLGKGAPSPSQRLRLQQENLDMRWNMSKKSNQTICCRQCAGEGVEECRFCAGTGMFKIGSELMIDPESGRPPPCPVCRSKGEEVCSRCNGVGRIAAWLFKSERRKWEDRPPPSGDP